MKLAGSSNIQKGLNGAASLLAIYTGVVTTINTSTSKFQPASYPFQAKTAIFLSRVIGPDLTKMILPAQAQAGLVSQGVTPFGVFNQNTFTGAGTLIADHVIRMMIGGKYGYRYAGPFVRAIGAGLMTGGVIGGLFDPDPSQITNPAPVNYPAITSTSPSVQIGMTQTASGGLQF